MVELVKAVSEEEALIVLDDTIGFVEKREDISAYGVLIRLREVLAQSGGNPSSRVFRDLYLYVASIESAFEDRRVNSFDNQVGTLRTLERIRDGQYSH